MSYVTTADGSKGPLPRHAPPQSSNPIAQAANTAKGYTQTPEQSRHMDPKDFKQINRENNRVRREEHKPNVGIDNEVVYVLTLKLTDSLADPMNSMREQYFPKRLNRTPAHLTLFHALPDAQLAAIESKLLQLATGTEPFFVSTGKPFRMRLGIGINVGKGFNRMKRIHQDLRSQWLPYLSKQDQGAWRPHWTIMNKVNEEEKVHEAFRVVESEMLENGREGYAIALDLWLYDKGYWNFVNCYDFKRNRSTLGSIENDRHPLKLPHTLQ